VTVTRVLVVDDDPNIVHLVKINLESEGYEVETASDGTVALDCIARNQPDAIVCDLMMPVTDGYTVLRTLRTDPATAKIPFVVLSAKVLPSEIQRALEMGADRYITKPFDPEDLLDAVAQLLLR
jgi:CheY-like chemotaxis protein